MRKGKPKSARCFVIQPFGTKESPDGEKTNHDLIFRELKKLEIIDPSFPVEIYRADTQKIKGDDLLTHVTKCIKESHFCIADLSGRNANVLYELGYARGLGKKVIVLCRNKSDVPGDIEGAMRIEYDIKALDRLPQQVFTHFDRVIDEIDNQIESDLLKVPYLPKRNDDLIRSKLTHARTKIDILQTNLSVLSYEFIDDITSSLDKNDGLELRILTLDPQSIFVNYRAHQLGYTEVGIFRNELSNSLENILFKTKAYDSRVRIKTYDDFPAQIAFHIDHEILACVVSAIGRSRDNCAFLIPDSLPGAHKSFVEHFDKLWNGNKSKEHDKRSGEILKVVT